MIVDFDQGNQTPTFKLLRENINHKAWNPSPLSRSSFTQTVVSCGTINGSTKQFCKLNCWILANIMHELKFSAIPEYFSQIFTARKPTA
jgi:hypothetical protein